MLSVPSPGLCANQSPRACQTSASAAAFAVGVILLFLLAAVPARAAQPEISFIQLFSTNQVLIHFDTAANRTYYLQYTDKMGTNGFAGSVWSNLFIVPRSVDANHFIVPDWRTNKARFYRLMVTP